MPVAYFWIVGRYGWSDTDDGFVLASAWRVFNGQTPYRDFVDIRPPTSAWLHSLWFALVPRPDAFATARLASIAEVWTYSLAATIALARIAGRRLTPAVFALALAGFLVAQSAFTPMPWHTVDGLFFCGLAAGLLMLRTGWRAAALAGVLMVAGMGAKQSFYPAAPLAIAYLLAERRPGDAAAFAAGAAVVVAGFFLWLARAEALTPFLQQTSARTGSGFVAQAGLEVYFDQGWPVLAALAAALAVAWVAARLARRRLPLALAVGIAGAMVAAEPLLRLLDEDGWVNASTLGFPHALFALALVVASARAARPATRRDGLAALFLLGLAWCASLSIGYPTPLLFAAPIVAVPILSRGADDAAPAWTALGFAGLVAALAALHPYEDRDARSADDCPLGRIEPGLALIVSGPETCAKLSEYERLRRTFPGPFVTLPGFGVSYMLADTLDPLSNDWPTLAEDAGASARLAAEADARVRYAFLETSELGQASGDQLMPLVDHIRAKWTRVAQGEVYAVYRNPLR